MTKLVDLTVAYLNEQVAAGAEAVQVFDSWVGHLSPADYRRFVQPHKGRLYPGKAKLIARVDPGRPAGRPLVWSAWMDKPPKRVAGAARRAGERPAGIEDDRRSPAVS